MLGIPLSTLKSIETGEFRPSYEVIRKIAKALELNPVRLVITDLKYLSDVSDMFRKMEEYFPAEYSVLPMTSWWNRPQNASADEKFADYDAIQIAIPDEKNSLHMKKQCSYSKTQLIEDIEQIQIALTKKYAEMYEQELHEQVRNLFEKILPPDEEPPPETQNNSNESLKAGNGKNSKPNDEK